MDPEPSCYFNSSMLLKASLLTISFTAIYFYRSGNRIIFLKKPPAKKDEIVATPVKKAAIKKKKKTIYLTFDDGPDKGSKNVMAVMKKEDINATLFIIGEHVYGSRDQQAIYDSVLHCPLLQVCNHSYTHAFENSYFKFYSEPDSAVKDFKRCADSLQFTNNIIRTPGRNIWRTQNISSTDLKASVAAADSLYKSGYTAVGWDVEWQFDNDQRLVQSDSEMIRIIDSAFAKKQTKTIGHLVLLAHDRTFKKSDDSATLHRFISSMKRKDEYEFEIVGQYPGVTKDSMTAK